MLDNAARSAQPTKLEPVSDPEVSSAEEAPTASLAEDIEALVEDGKTYLDAEIAFQKTRAGFAGQNTKNGVIYVLGALAFLHLALIGLVVGLIIALEPYLTAFGALGAVVGTLLVGVLIFGLLAVKRFKAVGSAFSSESDTDG